MDPYLYALVRKIFDCISSAFCKAMDMIGSNEPSSPGGDGSAAQSREAEECRPPPEPRPQGVKHLGGARLSITRGLEPASVSAPAASPGVGSYSQKAMLSQEEDEIERAMNEVRAFLNSYYTKSTAEGNMQSKLSTILSYFNECEKQAVGFLDTKMWEENIELEVGYREVMGELGGRRDHGRQGLEERWRQVVGGLIGIVDRLRGRRKGVIAACSCANSSADGLAAQLAQTMQSLHGQRAASKGCCEQAVQTAQAVELSTLHEFINEKTVLLENQMRQNTNLVDQIYKLKLELEGERHAKGKFMKLVESTSQELGKLKDVYYPLSEEMAQLEREYNALYEKLSGLWTSDIKQCVEEYSKEYTLEMRMSILHVVEAVLNKLGLFNLRLGEDARRKPKFKFRVGMFKAIEDFDLHESFAEEVGSAQVELEKARTTQKLRELV